MPLSLFKKLKRRISSDTSDRSEPSLPEESISQSVPEAPVELFVHEPLPNPKEDIRLIRRSRNGPQLSFDIFYVKQSAAPHYVALSYCLDLETSSTVHRCILLGGRTFRICENLYQALEHDCISIDSCAWIEAVCVNLDDVSEQSYQTRLRPAIFRSANQTVSWIGLEHADDVGSLLQLIQGFPSLREQYETDEDWHSANAFSVEENIHSSSTAISHLFKRPYWSRPQTLTEVAVSNDVVIQCGLFTSSLSALEALQQCLCSAALISAQESVPVEKMLSIRHTFQRTNKSFNVSDVLELSRGPLSVQNPHDRLYSVLGLISNSLQIQVDYQMPMKDLLVELATQRLLTEGPDILGDVQSGAIARRKGLPSWTMDLEAKSPRSYRKQFSLPFGIKHRTRPESMDIDFLRAVSHNLQSTAQSPLQTCRDLARYRASDGCLSSVRPGNSAAQIQISGRRVSTVLAVANACSSATFGSNRVQTWLMKQYKLQRFEAAEKWDKDLAVESENDSTIKFYNQPGEPFFPANLQQTEKLHWEQLMNPYSSFAQYWAFLDLSMGPSQRRMCSSEDHTDCTEADTTTDYEAFKQQVEFFDDARRAFRTIDTSLYGIGPEAVRPDDVVVILDGGSVPHILRHAVGADEWQYIGEAFVTGIMYGEVMATDVESEYFTLI